MIMIMIMIIIIIIIIIIHSPSARNSQCVIQCHLMGGGRLPCKLQVGYPGFQRIFFSDRYFAAKLR